MTNADPRDKASATTSRSEETPLADQATVALLVARFNDRITERLLEGANALLEERGCPRERRPVFRVPGCWELSLAADRLCQQRQPDAIVALGCLIRGETTHFDVLASAVARGLQQVSLERKLPVAFGVLTTENVAQALARCGGEHGNKGREAALAAVEMLDLYRRLG